MSAPPNTYEHALDLPLFPHKAIQLGRRCPRLRRWAFRRWRHGRWGHLIAYSRYELNVFFLFLLFLVSPQITPSSAPSSALSLAQLGSQLSSAAQRSAVRCRAVPCGTVRCRAVRCCAVRCCASSFVHTRYHTKVAGTRVCITRT